MIERLEKPQNATVFGAGVGVLTAAAQLLMGRKVSLLPTAGLALAAGVGGYLVGHTEKSTRLHRELHLMNRSTPLTQVSPHIEALASRGVAVNLLDLAWLESNQIWQLSPVQVSLPDDSKWSHHRFLRLALEHPLADGSRSYLRRTWKKAFRDWTRSDLTDEERDAPRQDLVNAIRSPSEAAALLASFSNFEEGMDREAGEVEAARAFLGLLLTTLKQGPHEAQLTRQHFLPHMNSQQAVPLRRLLGSLNLTNRAAILATTIN